MNQEFTTVSINNTIEYPFNNEQLRQIPYFDNKQGPKIAITCPIEIEFRHLGILSKVLKMSSPIPAIDCNSHLDVLIVIKLAKFFQIPDERITEGFAGWTEHRNWVNLWGPEYLYLIHLENEDLVDFKKFFRLHKSPFESVMKVATMPEIRSNPSVYIEMLLFFKNYNFNVCFADNNNGVQERILALTKARESIWETFLINPHAEFMTEYFKFIPTHYTVWDCKDISVIKTPEPLGPTIAPFDIAKQRMHEFTFGMFDKPLNSEVVTPFPFSNVLFAGGAAAKILAADYNHKNARQSDVDLFVFAKTHADRSRIFEEIINWFKTYGMNTPGVEIQPATTYYALRGSVTTIYVKNIARKFQVISINCSTPLDVIGRFDLSHIQWCVWNGQFFGTPEGCKAIRERVTRFGNTHRLKTERLIKALHCGYSIYQEQEILDNHIDITKLIEDPSSMQLQKLIRDLYGWYYPQSSADMDPEEERQHILCMIEKDSKATIVSENPIDVLNNVTIGGNFENDYESVLFSTFNAGIIENRVQGRRVQKVLLRSKMGAIRLTTSVLKVVKIINSETGIDIKVRPDGEEFRDFCALLEGNVFALFRPGGVTKKILNDDGEMKFSIPRYRLDLQNTRGISCLRSQRGESLNIEEDLREGDEIQVLFLIEMLMFPDERSVDLKPVKFVKYQRYDPEAAAKIRAQDEDIEKEIAQLEQYNGEIQYEDPLANAI